MSYLREPPEARRHPRSISIQHASVLGADLRPTRYLFAIRKSGSLALYSILSRFVAFTVYSCVRVSAVAPFGNSLAESLLDLALGLVYSMVFLAYPTLYFS